MQKVPQPLLTATTSAYKLLYTFSYVLRCSMLFAAGIDYWEMGGKENITRVKKFTPWHKISLFTFTSQ